MFLTSYILANHHGQVRSLGFTIFILTGSDIKSLILLSSPVASFSSSPTQAKHSQSEKLERMTLMFGLGFVKALECYRLGTENYLRIPFPVFLI